MRVIECPEESSVHLLFFLPGLQSFHRIVRFSVREKIVVIVLRGMKF
jgi:hypothetical protein